MQSFALDPSKKTSNNTQNPYDFAGVSVSHLSTIVLTHFLIPG